MTLSDLLQMGAAAIGGGGMTSLLSYVRNSRKDVRSDTLAWHTELMAEQRDWRETLRREINVLQEKLCALQLENANLLRKIAELEAHNDDLQRDNEGLEARVKELERELRKHDAAAKAGQSVVGL